MGEEGSGSKGAKRRKRYEAPVIWLWFAGRDLDEEGGKGRTNATWLEDYTRVFHPTGHAGKWSRMRHWKRSAIRQSLVLGAVLVAWDWWHHPAVTILALSALAVIYGGHHVHRGTRKYFPLKHYWQYVRPFSLTLRAELGIVPLYLKVAPDRSSVVVGLPHEYLGSDHERAAITKAVTEKLAIEAPDATWRLSGRSHEVEFAHSEPPPSLVTWEEIAEDVRRAKPHELVVGIGKQGHVVKASLESDSPHLGIGMGTGAGKSNLAAFWLLQRLMCGDMVAILDGKRTSHPWAFKNMDYEYDQLPNVAYARRIDDIHDLLVWLGAELARRNELSEDWMNARGHLRDSIGARWFILLEEMNMVVPMLKTYWARLRAQDPGLDKKSPALLALGALSYAGRAVWMNEIFLGQRLHAAVFGCSPSEGGAVRGQVGARAIARYDEPAWKLQAPGTPMPPSPSVPGRIQMWLGGDVHETQVPLMDFEQVRKLAVSGVVTPARLACRAGRRTVSVLHSTTGIPQAPEQPESVGLPPDTDKVTLPEAHRLLVFGDQKLATIQRYSTRPGFPASTGEWKGNAKVYLLADLYAYQSKRERVSA